MEGSLPLFVRLGPAGERAVRARVDETPMDLVRALARGWSEGHGLRDTDVSTDANACRPRSDVSLAVRGGRRLDLRVPLARQCEPWATLELVAPLRGGGGDGGATGAESRSSYLEMYARRKEDPGDPAAARRARWTTCALSGEPLRPPVALDEAGALYNKDAVLTALLERRVPEAMRYVTGLSSIVELKPTAGRDAEAAAPAARPSVASLFACPVTGMSFVDPNHFVVHRPTGQVFSVRATREAREAVEDMTGGRWRADEWTPVNPPEDEAAELRRAALHRAEERKRLKREKREKKRAVGGDGEEKGPGERRDRPGERSGRGDGDADRGDPSARSGRPGDDRREDVRRRDEREEGVRRRGDRREDVRRRDGRGEERCERRRERCEDGWSESARRDRRGDGERASRRADRDGACGTHRGGDRDSSRYRSHDEDRAGRRPPASCRDASPRASAAKRTRTDLVPAGANPDVWNSIFKDRSKERDSYMCRGNVGRGMAL